MKSRTEKLRQFSFTSTSKQNLFQTKAQPISYDAFCHHMNIIGGYRTMVIGGQVVENGTTTRSQADRSAEIVNANMQHMDRYQRDLSMEAANPGRGNK